MFEITFAVFILFFFCWGIGEFMHSLKVFFVSSKKKEKNIIISFLNNSTGVKQARKFIEKYKWYGTEYADKLIFVFDDLNEEVNKKILEMVKNDRNVFCCNKESLTYVISKFDEENNEQSGPTTNS